MTTMITLRRRFAVAVAGVATAAATTVTLAPWLPHQQMPPMSMAQLPTPATARGADRGTTQPGRLPKPPPSSRVATPTARCSPVSPPAAPSPPTIGHTREELDPPWPPP
ncbi:Hypothetical protein AFL40_1335 [Mycobacterium tuberculosis]|nr:Hypothetical protein AFL40_1335 [Mycobacterium tuberculosis]ANZ81936.1 Hypothetical protein BEE65_1333 [Mycobacterium tuberculosis]AOE35635.1 Hypothetical protein BEE64_1328 [Mycobacterium tuberculosis]EFD76944.1 conserved secreted protein [Mycobacterium tuberculosis T85]